MDIKKEDFFLGKIKVLNVEDVKVIVRVYKKEMIKQIDNLRGRVDVLEREREERGKEETQEKKAFRELIKNWEKLK